MRWLIIIVLLWIPFTSRAQQELLLNALTGLPQASATNPGLPPTVKGWTFGLPSLAFNYGNNAFAFNDLTKKYSSDSVVYDVENVLSKLERENIIQYQVNADLMRVVWSRGEWFVSALITEKMNVKFSYPKALLDFFWYGNASYVGDTLSIGPRLNAVYYREISLGGGYTFKGITVGMRAKLLTGMANVVTEDGDLQLFTDPSDYSLYVNSSYFVRTAGVENFQKDVWSAAMNFGNPGYAFDFGFSANILPDVIVQGSVNNLGRIRWKNDVSSYQVKGSYNFQGLSLNQYFEADTLDISNFTDTLRTIFYPKKDSSSFSSELVPRSYLNVQWKPTNKSVVGVMAFADFFDDVRPAFSVFGSYRFFPFLETGLSMSWKNYRWDNIGLAIIGDIGKVQLYAISDNVAGLISPRNSRNVNFRVGVNLVFEQ